MTAAGAPTAAEGIEVRHLDLSAALEDHGASPRPALTILWWRNLPIGMVTGSADEVPLSPGTCRSLLARFAAEQLASRDPQLGAPLYGGAEGDPRQTLDLAGIMRAEVSLDRLDRIARVDPVAADQLSVIVCTRDRPEALARCLERLGALRSPPGELIVVDNSSDGNVASLCAGRPGVRYVHEPRPGLSNARNAGIKVASRSFVAFTDDDVEPHPEWSSEVVRALIDSGADAVTGLVLPARLESSAQVLYQMEMGGFGTRFTPVRYDRSFYDETRRDGAHVWRIGAGANMAFRREVFDRLGPFDPRLGAGASGCSEDSEYWYRIVATGGTCLYEPRAVVFHDHRDDWPGLKDQMQAYLRGHVSALVAQADLFGDRGNITRIYRQLPGYFARTLIYTFAQNKPARRAILGAEVRGWLGGQRYLFRRKWRRSGPVLPQPGRIAPGRDTAQ